MSGEDEQFCKCTKLNSVLNFVLIITLLEAGFHLGFVWPATKMFFEDNMLLYLGIMIPLALLTTVRSILMVYARCNSLDFFAREKNFYFYLISTVVEWIIFMVWAYKYYSTGNPRANACELFDFGCLAEDIGEIGENWANVAFVIYIYLYFTVGVGFKVFFNYVNFRFYMS